MPENNKSIIEFMKFAIIAACCGAITFSIVNSNLGQVP